MLRCSKRRERKSEASRPSCRHRSYRCVRIWRRGGESQRQVHRRKCHAKADALLRGPEKQSPEDHCRPPARSRGGAVRQRPLQEPWKSAASARCIINSMRMVRRIRPTLRRKLPAGWKCAKRPPRRQKVPRPLVRPRGDEGRRFLLLLRPTSIAPIVVQAQKYRAAAGGRHPADHALWRLKQMEIPYDAQNFPQRGHGRQRRRVKLFLAAACRSRPADALHLAVDMGKPEWPAAARAWREKNGQTVTASRWS